MRTSRIAALALTTALAFGAGSGVANADPGAGSHRAKAGPSATAPGVTPGWRQRMLARVNSVRLLAGVPPLVACARLNHSAQSYAGTMARTNTFGHLGPDGTGPGERVTAVGYRWSLLGENIAAGQRNVYEAMQGWRGSATHLATMTDPRFTHIGFGYATAPASTYTRYWVQDYGSGRC